MPKPFTLILASASPRRCELLTRLNIPFRIEVANVDETPFAEETPIAMTERLAQAKAEAIYKAHATNTATENIWVLGADTTVAIKNTIFGKPENREQAKQTLTRLSSNTHQVISSICLLGKKDGMETRKIRSVVSNVRFGALSELAIEAYCDTKEPYDKAGAYGIQGDAGAFVEHIDGDYSAIMGLPLWTTRALFIEVGLL